MLEPFMAGLSLVRRIVGGGVPEWEMYRFVFSVWTRGWRRGQRSFSKCCTHHAFGACAHYGFLVLGIYNFFPYFLYYWKKPLFLYTLWSVSNLCCGPTSRVVTHVFESVREWGWLTAQPCITWLQLPLTPLNLTPIPGLWQSWQLEKADLLPSDPLPGSGWLWPWLVQISHHLGYHLFLPSVSQSETSLNCSKMEQQVKFAQI